MKLKDELSTEYPVQDGKRTKNNRKIICKKDIGNTLEIQGKYACFCETIKKFHKITKYFEKCVYKSINDGIMIITKS